MKRIKKLLGLILVGILLLPLASCDSQNNAKTNNLSEDKNVLVFIGKENNLFYYYDKDTKVMYVAYVGMNMGGVLTPLYNPDGTLKLYEESES